MWLLESRWWTSICCCCFLFSCFHVIFLLDSRFICHIFSVISLDQSVSNYLLENSNSFLITLAVICLGKKGQTNPSKSLPCCAIKISFCLNLHLAVRLAQIITYQALIKCLNILNYISKNVVAKKTTKFVLRNIFYHS